MKTAEFGGMWGSHGAAVTVTVPTKTITSPDAFLAAITKVNINPVDKIAASTCRRCAGCFIAPLGLTLRASCLLRQRPRQSLPVC